MKKSSFASSISAFTLGLVLFTGTGFTLNSNTDHPDGYMAGRNDAKYGTYGSVVQPSARSYQDRVVSLQSKAYGLSTLLNRNLVEQSEAGYLLENQLIRLDMDIANAPSGVLTSFERRSLMYQVVRAYQTVRQQSERLYENMIRYIDHELPGPNGQQIRSEIPETSESAYDPNYRSDQDLTQQQRATLYTGMVDAFEKGGGSLNEIKILDSNYIKAMGDLTRVEYVQLTDGTIRVTEGKAGHILLAGGRSVKSAGQIVFVKDTEGKVVLLILSNASGSFKPDILSAELFAENLEKITHVSKMNVVVTKGEPLSTQAVKIYLKGQRVDANEVKRQVKELEQRGESILFPSISVPECAAVFS